MNKLSAEEKVEIKELSDLGYTQREIGLKMGRGKSTIGDYLRTLTSDLPTLVTEDTTPLHTFESLPTTQPVEIVTSKTAPSECTHIMIPDLQIKPGIDMSYLSWIGQYLACLLYTSDAADE